MTAARITQTIQPVAIQLGKITFAWNGLHASLAELFADISTAARPMSFAIWHSAPSDRTQREMLQAALRSINDTDETLLRLRDETFWLLGTIEDGQCRRRNRALHVPLTIIRETTGEYSIGSYYYDGNPHAQQLKDTPVLEEFRWYVSHLQRLACFADELHCAWMYSDHETPFPWPERPQLPHRGQFPSQRKGHRKNDPKSHERPPRSFPG